MNILVTGCFGFIGSNLISNLLNQGHKVIGFDNLSRISINPTDRIKARSGKNWENFKFYRQDITDLPGMKSIVAANGHLDAVIHLAAIGSVPLSFLTPSKSLEANVVGFANIIEMIRSFQIKRLVFASSSSVYGISKINPRVEGSEGKTISPYALSKKVNEELAIMLTPSDTTFVGLRFFNVYGPGQPLRGDYSAVIPRFITEEKPQVFGDGNTTRDYTFVDDVTDAIQKSLFCSQSAIVNIGTGTKTTLNELLKYLNKLDQAEYKEERLGDVQASWADTTAANKVLKWSATVGLPQGLAATKAFYDEFMQEGKEKENA